MIRIVLATVFIIAALMIVPAQEPEQDEPTVALTEQQASALVELAKAEQAYDANKYTVARRHAEKAFELDPANRDGLIIIARSIRALVRDNDESSVNIVRARDAIAAYLRISTEPDENEVYNAVKELYGAIGENDLKYEWIMQRAINFGLPVEMRSEAYMELALLDLNAFRLRNAGAGEALVPDETHSVEAISLDSATRNQIAQGKEILSRGIRMAKQAIALSPERDYAWTLEIELLRSIAGLFELEENKSLAEQHKSLASKVAARHQELKAEREEALLARMIVVDCDLLCNRVINTPRPRYPAIARTARAGGEVVVHIAIDETGNVISAYAFSGHPLLRAAAVQAARLSTFSPMPPSENPVTTYGSLIYRFNLRESIPIDISKMNRF